MLPWHTYKHIIKECLFPKKDLLSAGLNVNACSSRRYQACHVTYELKKDDWPIKDQIQDQDSDLLACDKFMEKILSYWVTWQVWYAMILDKSKNHQYIDSVLSLQHVNMTIALYKLGRILR